MPSTGILTTPGEVSRWRIGHRRSRASGDEPRVGVDGRRMADGGQEREVIDAVGVGVALGQRDPPLLGELADRRDLAAGPDERAGEPAVEAPVRAHGIPGRDDVVEAEPLRERPDEVLRGRRREDDPAPGRVMLLDEGMGEGVDHPGDDGRRGLGGGVERVRRAASGDPGRLTGQGDRGQRLAEQVVDAVEQALAGQGPLDHPELHHRPGQDLTGAAGQQRPVEVEERGALHTRQATGPRRRRGTCPSARRTRRALR